MKSKYLITDVGKKDAGILTDRAVYITNGKIVEIDDYPSLKEKYPEALVKGNGDQLLMPGLIDAHCHGLGLSPFQHGIPYDFLENNFFDWAYLKPIDPELNAMVSAVRHLRNGCTTLHCNTGGPLEKTARLIEGFQQSGIRLNFSLAGSDYNSIALNNTEFVNTLPNGLQEFMKPIICNDKHAIRAEYFATFDQLHERYHSDRTRINFGPSFATTCTDAFLHQIQVRAEQMKKLPIHIHTLQTPIQQAYALKKYGKSQVAHFADIHFLNDNLTLGHAVFLLESDIELLASHQVSTTHHPNCNLVMRNGISPVYHLIKSGVNVALGIDDKGFNDDDDPITELRLLHRLHRVSGFDLRHTPALDAFEILKMGMTNAARVSGYDDEIGTITPGMKADIILVDLQELMNDPWMAPEMNIAEIFLHRAQGRHVNTVMVDGKILIEDRHFLSIDLKQLYEEVGKQMVKGLSAEQKAYAAALQQIKPYCQLWYNDWIDSKSNSLYGPGSQT